MTVELNQKIIDELIATARKKSCLDGIGEDDFFDAQDWSGGNFDDCFSIGQTAGEIQAARDLLDQLGIDYA